jgi:hypothetical protein
MVQLVMVRDESRQAMPPLPARPPNILPEMMQLVIVGEELVQKMPIPDSGST